MTKNFNTCSFILLKNYANNYLNRINIQLIAEIDLIT